MANCLMYRDSASNESALPHIADASITTCWLPHAKFDHEAHGGFTCVSCHEKALRSSESSDLLLPGIKNCQTCHAPGPDHAESRCFECHTYHDWSKRKEIAPTFSFPPLKPAAFDSRLHKPSIATGRTSPRVFSYNYLLSCPRYQRSLRPILYTSLEGRFWRRFRCAPGAAHAFWQILTLFDSTKLSTHRAFATPSEWCFL